jgi:hypothetical protein
LIAHLFARLADRFGVERCGDSIWCGEIRKKKKKKKREEIKSICLFIYFINFFFQFLFLIKKLVLELNNIKKLAEVAVKNSDGWKDLIESESDLK